LVATSLPADGTLKAELYENLASVAAHGDAKGSDPVRDHRFFWKSDGRCGARGQ